MRQNQIKLHDMNREKEKKNEGAKTLLMVSEDELREIVKDAVRDERERTEKRIREAKEVAAISRNEAARMLSVSLNTLWRWAKDGYLIPRKVGTKVMYLRSDVERIIMRGYDETR